MPNSVSIILDSFYNVVKTYRSNGNIVYMSTTGFIISNMVLYVNICRYADYCICPHISSHIQSYKRLISCTRISHAIVL